MACKHGIEKTDCDQANNALVQIGIPRLYCQNCKLDDVCNEVVEALTDTKRSAKQGRIWLKRMGLETGLVDSSASIRTGFRCPVIKETISTPCAMSKCAWHIDYPWSANCLLAYQHHQESDTLSPEEISYLYQLPVGHVRDVIDKATASLRSTAIDTHAEEEQNTREFVYFITDRVCCVCEEPTDDVPRALQIASVGAVYCSKECRNEKHPRLIELEIEKGLPIGKILDWTFRNYRSLSLAEAALGIPRWLAYESCRRYLNQPIENYFASLKTIQTHRQSMLIRRTWHSPAWVNSMIAKVKPVTRMLMDRFGPSRWERNGIKQELDHLLQNL